MLMIQEWTQRASWTSRLFLLLVSIVIVLYAGFYWQVEHEATWESGGLKYLWCFYDRWSHPWNNHPSPCCQRFQSSQLFSSAIKLFVCAVSVKIDLLLLSGVRKKNRFTSIANLKLSMPQSYLEVLAWCPAVKSSLAPAFPTPPVRLPSGLAGKRLEVERAFRYLLPRHRCPNGMHKRCVGRKKGETVRMLMRPLTVFLSKKSAFNCFHLARSNVQLWKTIKQSRTIHTKAKEIFLCTFNGVIAEEK